MKSNIRSESFRLTLAQKRLSAFDGLAATHLEALVGILADERGAARHEREGALARDATVERQCGRQVRARVVHGQRVDDVLLARLLQFVDAHLVRHRQHLEDVAFLEDHLGKRARLKQTTTNKSLFKRQVLSSHNFEVEFDTLLNL